MRVHVPPGYCQFRRGKADVVAQGDAVAIVTEHLETSGSLYAAAASDPASEYVDGRRRVYLLPVAGDRRWVVRRLHHGGMLAGLTRDLFWHRGVPRPLNELILAAELRTRGISTPLVAAVCIFHRGCFYRGEVAREEIPDALDLARFVFDVNRPDSKRRAALHAAGVLVRRLHDVGLYHPDLNLRNILVSQTDASPEAHIIDLEKCCLQPQLSRRDSRRMLARAQHSAQRFADRTGITLIDAGWEEFRRGYGEETHGAR